MTRAGHSVSRMLNLTFDIRDAPLHHRNSAHRRALSTLGRGSKTLPCVPSPQRMPPPQKKRSVARVRNGVPEQGAAAQGPVAGPRIAPAEDTADNSPLEACQPSGTNPRQNHPLLKQIREPVLGGAGLQVRGGGLSGPFQGRATPAAKPQAGHLSLRDLDPN